MLRSPDRSPATLPHRRPVRRRRPRPAGLALLLATVLSALAAAPVRPPAARAQDELVAEFRRFYTSDRSEAERREAVLVLEGSDSLAAAQALLPAFEDEAFAVRRAAIEVVGGYRDEAAITWLLEGVLTERKHKRKTVLRAGVAEALGRMGDPRAYEALAELLGEREDELRYAGVAALGALGDPRACPALSALVADAGEDGALVVSALDALIAIGDGPGAQAAVLGALTYPEQRVRAKAIAGVLELRLKDGIRPLIARMREETGRLQGDAYDALKTLTMRSFPDVPDTWAAWWDRNEAKFELPDPEAVAEARRKLAETGTRYTSGQKRFLGIETKSDNIMFVIDVSGSMETLFDEPERLAATGRTYASLQRLEIVKQELMATIDDLPESTRFNILAFATDVEPWRKASSRANVLNKNAAKTWVSELEPIGSGAAAFQATTGLGSAGVSAGQTNTHLALMTAFGESVEGDASGAGFVREVPREDIDTIFFLTDGDPTVGRTLDMGEIRQEVRRVNAYRGVQLHVIYVGSVSGRDLEWLAKENGGVFVEIGG